MDAGEHPGTGAKGLPGKAGAGKERRSGCLPSPVVRTRSSAPRKNGLPRRGGGGPGGRDGADRRFALDESWKDYIRAAVAAARLSRVLDT